MISPPGRTQETQGKNQTGFFLRVRCVLSGGALTLCAGALALLTVSCAPSLMKLPTGPGAAASDAVDVLNEASRMCRVQSMSAEVGVRGKVNGQRLRARLLVGVARPASARIEALAPFGAPAFVLSSAGDVATLLLPRDNRVLEHRHVDEILAALTGVPLSAEELRMTLSGCWSSDVVAMRAIAYGAEWRKIIVQPDHGLWLHREDTNAPWRVVAVMRNIEHSGRRWGVQYGAFQNDIPRSIHIASADSEAAGTYELDLSLSQVETNVPLGADVFRVQMPRSAEPITLDELRHARPGVREN